MGEISDVDLQSQKVAGVQEFLVNRSSSGLANMDLESSQPLYVCVLITCTTNKSNGERSGIF